MLWSPYGNEGMGYKNFACVESVKVRGFVRMCVCVCVRARRSILSGGVEVFVPRVS